MLWINWPVTALSIPVYCDYHSKVTLNIWCQIFFGLKIVIHFLLFMFSIEKQLVNVRICYYLNVYSSFLWRFELHGDNKIKRDSDQHLYSFLETFITISYVRHWLEHSCSLCTVYESPQLQICFYICSYIGINQDVHYPSYNKYALAS